VAHPGYLFEVQVLPERVPVPWGKRYHAGTIAEDAIESTDREGFGESWREKKKPRFLEAPA
jgi:hypothetical protein